MMVPIRLPSLLGRLKVRCLFGFSLQSTNEVLRLQEEASRNSRELLRVQEEASRDLLRVQEEASRREKKILREVIGAKEEILEAREEILRVKDEATLLADVAHRLRSEKQALCEATAY